MRWGLVERSLESVDGEEEVWSGLLVIYSLSRSIALQEVIM